MSGNKISMEGKRPEASYFEAWRERSTDVILSVVCDDIEYRLREDLTLRGKEQLKNYWDEDVVKRQSNVDVIDTAIELDSSESRFIFYAKFHDRKESSDKSLLGNIHFELDANGKIKKIFENFSAVKGDGPKEIVRPLKASAKLLLQALFSTASLVAIFRGIYRFVLVVSAIIVLLFFFPMLVPVGWIGSGVELLGGVKAEEVEISAPEVRGFILRLFPFLGILAVIFSALERWSEARGGISQITRRTRQAEEVLASNLRSCDKAVILGGDFSYISASRNLLDQLERLSLKGDLLLLSSCSKDQIVASNGRSPRTVDLLRRMIAYGQLRENANPNNHRFALMEAGEDRRLILKNDNGVLMFKRFLGSPNLLQLVMDIVDEAYKP